MTVGTLPEATLLRKPAAPRLGAVSTDLPPDLPADLPVDSWLTLPDVAERLGIDVGRVRRLVQDRRVIAVRQGERRILSVPERFLARTGDGWEVVPALQGTLVLLADAGYSDAEAIRWLFTPDASLAVQGWSPPGVPTPVDALAAGHKTEVRRRAQALAL